MDIDDSDVSFLSDHTPEDPMLRRKFPVGNKLSLPPNQEIFIGDDMTWEGSETTRAICINTQGSHGSTREWAYNMGNAVKNLGAEIFTLCETRLHGKEQHYQAVEGLAQAGYIAISHNVPIHRAAPDDSDDDVPLQSPLASGVIIGVKNTYCGTLSDVTKGPHGRAASANITNTTGTTIRITGLYGITGACATDFASRKTKLRIEDDVNKYTCNETDTSRGKGQHSILMGDGNSYTNILLDHYGGPALIRTENLAYTISDLGATDTFRNRHADTRAFTHVHHTGTASRLDYIWLLPSPGTNLPILDAAILWKWPHSKDHDVAMCDFFCTIPEIALPTDNKANKWKKTVEAMQTPSSFSAMKAHVLETISPFRAQIEDTCRELEQVCISMGRERTGERTTPSPTPHKDLRTMDLRAKNNLRQANIEVPMMDALPTLSNNFAKQYANRVRSASEAWAHCITLLHGLERITPTTHSHKKPYTEHKTLTSYAWNNAKIQQDKLIQNNQSRTQIKQSSHTCIPLVQTDFLSWAQQYGFTNQHCIIWLGQLPTDTSISTHSAPSCPTELAATFFVHSDTKLAEWITLATSARKSCLKGDGKEFYNKRTHFLYINDVKTWAGQIRSKQSNPTGFTPTWLNKRETNKKRPETKNEAMLATRQEWSLLLQCTKTPWQHPLILEITNNFFRARSTFNIQAYCQTPIGSPLQRIGKAIMGPEGIGPHMIPFNHSEIHINAVTNCITIPGLVMNQHTNGSWTGTHTTGRTNTISHISGHPADQWDTSSWYQAIASTHAHGIVLMDQPNNNPWNDLIGPTTIAERHRMILNSKNSSPGLVDWKPYYLPLYPAWAQEAYWQWCFPQRR